SNELPSGERQVIKLLPIMRPPRIVPAVCSDLLLPARVLEWFDVHVVPAGLIRMIGNPSAIGREGGIGCGILNQELRLLISAWGQCCNTRAAPTGPIRQDQDLAVGRP